tara:strand:- start:3028 stop:5475 length:2448 start_codon:yes stop_codon:yes gene_type:complete
MIDARKYILDLTIPEKVSLFKELYSELSGYGDEGDTELAHVNTFEVSVLKSLGGLGTINEMTGLVEFKGGGSAPAPPATQTVTQATQFPEELRPFIQDILGEAQTEFQREKGEGFQPFPGPQVAGFTPEQEAAFSAGREQFTGLAGTPLGEAATYARPALAATALGTSEVGTEDIQRRMDPFLQNVVDIQKRETRSDEDIARQRRAAEAVAGQGFLGGTRPAFVESQAEQDLAERLGDIQARGLSTAFQNAQRTAEAQRQRELAGGRQFAALGDITGQRARSDIAGLAGIGETQQQRNQQALDIARREFLQEQQFPAQTLGKYSSVIRGFPYTMGGTTVSQQTVPTPSLAQTLTGGLSTAAGLYGMFGGFGGGARRNKGGGLVSLQGGGLPQVPSTGAQNMIPMVMRMYAANPQFKNKIDRDLAQMQQQRMPRFQGTNLGTEGINVDLGLAGVPQRNTGGLVSLWHGGPVEEHKTLQKDWFDPNTYLKPEHQIAKKAGASVVADEEELSELEKMMVERGESSAPRSETRGRRRYIPRSINVDLEGIKGIITEDINPLQQLARKQIDETIPYAEVEKRRRKFYDETEARAQRRKMQSLYASLIAGGAGVLGADPQKGYAAAVGEGIQAGLPVAAAGMEDYYETTEKARGLEREEEIAGRTYDLENTLRKLKLAQDSVTNPLQLAQIEATIAQATAELEAAYAAAGIGQADEPDISRAVDTILNEFYGAEELKAIGPTTQLYQRLMNEATEKVMDRIDTELSGIMPGDLEYNKMLLEEARPLFEKHKGELMVGAQIPTLGTDSGNSASVAIEASKDE